MIIIFSFLLVITNAAPIIIPSWIGKINNLATALGLHSDRLGSLFGMDPRYRNIQFNTAGLPFNLIVSGSSNEVGIFEPKTYNWYYLKDQEARDGVQVTIVRTTDRKWVTFFYEAIKEYKPRILVYEDRVAAWMLKINPNRVIDDRVNDGSDDKVETFYWKEPTFHEGMIFQLKNRQSGKCMYARETDQWGVNSCNKNYQNQWWVIQYENDDGRYCQIRNIESDICLFSSSDERFGMYDCHEDYEDQYWEFIDITTETNDFQLKNDDSEKCLFSNSDGRFNVYTCVETISDQHWEVLY